MEALACHDSTCTPGAFQPHSLALTNHWNAAHLRIQAASHLLSGHVQSGTGIQQLLGTENGVRGAQTVTPEPLVHFQGHPEILGH